MAKAVLGIDFGTNDLKLALVKGKEVRKTAVASVPQNLVKNGWVVSVEAMGELLRTTMRKNHIRCSRGAVVLSGDSVYVRTMTTPLMTADQLVYNLPYEFKDYITDEPKNYAFDYAMLSTVKELESRTEGPRTMELMAAAVPKTMIEDASQILRKAGLKLVKAAPAVSAYISLIRAQGGGPDREYCLLDLGYSAIRMYMFKGERHMVTRELESGFSALDQTIAEAYNVDVHLAHTYFIEDFDECQTKECCMEVYRSIAVELMRALNFYRFSNPDSQLTDLWLLGGGSVIPLLREVIETTLDMTIHSARELLPGKLPVKSAHNFLQAAGVAMEQGGKR